MLHTEKDFVIIDFEGEPARPVTERRLKRSPIVDVAGMLRSLHYAGEAALLEHLRPEDVPKLRPWRDLWLAWSSAAYLEAYLKGVGPAGIIPAEPDDLKILLDAHLLHRAVYEVEYELNSRPEWVRVPLEGLAMTMGLRAGAGLVAAGMDREAS